MLAGALSAETYRLSLPRATTAAASLIDRRMEPPRWRQQARALVVAAMVTALVAAVTGHGIQSLLPAGLGLVSAFVGEATHRAIESRRRPVLSNDARAVDQLLRRYALAGSARLQLAASLLTVSWIGAKLDLADPVASTTRGVVVFASLIASMVQLRRSAPRAPRGWRPTP